VSLRNLPVASTDVPSEAVVTKWFVLSKSLCNATQGYNHKVETWTTLGAQMYLTSKPAAVHEHSLRSACSCSTRPSRRTPDLQRLRVWGLMGPKEADKRGTMHALHLTTCCLPC
jgi:hypothetical protein